MAFCNLRPPPQQAQILAMESRKERLSKQIYRFKIYISDITINMEEDNAGDIIKWLFKDSTKLDCSGNVKIIQDGDTRYNHWDVRLRGNLLAMKPLDYISEPLLIVCEKIQIDQPIDRKNTLIIKQNKKELVMTFENETEFDKWILKLMTCSHRIVQADYDQILYTRFTQPLPASSTNRCTNNSLDYFLTSPYSKEQFFSLSQSLNFPSRQIKCCETMYESKLSMLVPQEMLRQSLKWDQNLRDELLDKLWGVKNSAIVEALHTAVRHLNSNIEIHTQACEYLDTYSGPSFRPSTEKYRVSFLYVPTNMHIQSFHVDDRLVSNFITIGTLSAMPLRFSGGGLYKLKNKFATGLGPIALDHINETRFYSRQQTLQSLKRRIGDLSRRIDTSWHVVEDGKPDQVGIEIFSDMKQMYETLTDMISSFPNINNLVDSLCEGGLAQMQHKNEETVPRDSLANQLDYLQAQFVSLNSKMTAVDRMENQDSASKNNYEESVRASVHSTLDAIYHLVASLICAQMLSLVQCFRKKSDCQTFFHLQLRHDALLSQAIAVVISILLTAIYDPVVNLKECWANARPLITFFSFLSCYGDEQGMIEDSFEMWHLFQSVVSFRFVKLNSSVSQTCIPNVEGYRTSLKISIPIHGDKMVKLPEYLADGNWFVPKVIFWNLGVNHEASLAASIGDISFEEEVNREALRQMVEYSLLFSAVDAQMENAGLVEQLLGELQQTVSACPSRKNILIFSQVMALNSALGGVPVISCKSGKDRTSMAATLEEGRILRETCGISNKQMSEIVECLRRNGVRRENCRKNVGRPLFAFSPFQMNFLPKELRPPFGTFTNLIAS